MPADYQLWIDGAPTDAASGETFETLDPSTGQAHATVARAGRVDVGRAVAAARAAFEDGRWSGLKPERRAAVLQAVAAKLKEEAGRLVDLEVRDSGGTVRKTRSADVSGAMFTFRTYAELATRLPAEQPLPFTVAPGPSHNYVRREPVGVCAAIVPWNFPIQNAAWKLAPALAAGNTVVLKPAETTPLTALRLGEVLQEAELPEGVVNILTGAGATGAALVGHDGVDKVAFTGSTEVGKAIQRTLAGSGKKLTLELGGKAANIVFEDAPLDQAVEGIVNGIYFNQGHVCCAGSRLLVQESIAEPLVDKLKRRMATLRVGDPLDKNTDIGAINSRAQLDRIQELVAAGEAEGAEAWQAPCELPSRGFWFRPTVFTSVAQSHRIAREEIFGPVLSVLTFRTPDEAVEKANNTPYGLSAGVWTDKGSRILELANRLRAGVVWANTFNRFDPASPFGGYRESGFGREGGRHGLAAYLDLS